MSFPPVLPESGNAQQGTGAGKLVIYLLPEQPGNAISLSRVCGQSAVIAEVAFVKSARKKALLTGDERARIERGRAEIDQSAVNEVADFDGSDRPLRNIGHCATIKPLLFAPIIVNEDRAAVAVDLVRPVSHAHIDRDALSAADIYITV